MARLAACGDVIGSGFPWEVTGLPDSDTSLWAKDVQRLLWAAGEARGRRREKRPAVHRRAAKPSLPAGGDGFFTEWQPAAGA